MTYNEKSIIKDVNKKPVPQYWNKETQQFEVVESKDGMLRVNMVDSEGREIQSQDLVDQISSKLDELVDEETIKSNELERIANEQNRQSNEEERELNESNRVSAETDRVQAEITRQEGYNQAIDNFSTDSTQAINDFNTQGQQAINDFDTQGQQKIDDFVTETERVEAIYPTRLTNVENDLAQHKLDYMAHRFQDLKNDKIYKFGFQVSAEGNPQLIYEEVIE